MSNESPQPATVPGREPGVISKLAAKSGGFDCKCDHDEKNHQYRQGAYGACAVDGCGCHRFRVSVWEVLVDVAMG